MKGFGTNEVLFQKSVFNWNSKVHGQPMRDWTLTRVILHVMKITKIQLPSRQQCKQTALGDTTIGNVAGMANYGTSFAEDWPGLLTLWQLH